MFSAIGAGISAIGSFITNRQNIKNQNRMFEKQAEFSRQEAQVERDWQERMYNTNNAYNSPAAQMQRYKEAGLNPDLVYSDGSLSSPASAPSAAGIASTPSVGAAHLDNPFGDAGQIISQKRLVDSQARANDAKANRDNKESDIASARLVMDKAKSESEIRLNDSSVYLNHRIGELRHAELEQVAASVNNLNASTGRLLQETENLRKEIEVQDERISTLRFERFIRSQEFDQSVKESNSRIADNYASASLKKQQKRTEVYRTSEAMNQAGITEQEYRIAVATYVEQVAGVKARNNTDVQVLEKVKKQLGILDIESARAQFNFDKDKQYSDLERSLGLASDFIGACTDAVVAYKSFGISKLLKGRGTPPATPPSWSGGVPSTPFN